MFEFQDKKILVCGSATPAVTSQRLLYNLCHHKDAHTFEITGTAFGYNTLCYTKFKLYAVNKCPVILWSNVRNDSTPSQPQSESERRMPVRWSILCLEMQKSVGHQNTWPGLELTLTLHTVISHNALYLL